ncbi:transmembrane protein 101-like [Lingula anatina]|uniref:Transmembrane protein 101-like n=1 Tax=Lingula anatina TaxID=7574 RepID=A0A1S3H4F0_LINAN|nr:transmembrane protein 101-like [Lingula anatina]XP_013380343.1 transmembrane protein 101-like [Lingula anatina]|eukprot:XP_013380341.1 transmembrane protein 101-like [Lingula anatina]
MADWRDWALKACLFFLSRFPLVNAVTLLMVIGATAIREEDSPLPPKLVYGHVIVQVVCGMAYQLKWKRKEVSLILCGQMLHLAYVALTYPKLQYSDWLRVKIASRLLGPVGVYLYFADLLNKTSSKQLRKSSEAILGTYLVCISYLLLNSSDDKNGLKAHLPGGDWALYVIVGMLGACSVALFSGMYLRDACYLTIGLITLYSVFIEGDIDFWTKRRRVPYWVHIRLILDNVCVIVGLIFMRLMHGRKMKID